MFVFNLKIKAKKTVILAAVLSVTANLFPCRTHCIHEINHDCYASA